jgi:ubiquinone/menaquinone biosynthesis C-methylase UbiE
MKNHREIFWKKRAQNYEKLEWAIKGGYLHAFLDAGTFTSKDYVLDIGTGTGIIAHTISPFVEKVIGIDISSDMLSYAFEHKTGNEEFLKMDAHNLDFADNTFSKVTARMVFHHILEDTQEAMNECYRVLKDRGKMIFSEGVPPSEHVKSFYTRMFKLKEERLTFMDSDLINIMRKAGFSKIDEVVYWVRHASIKNWLKNSGLDSKTQHTIMKMHGYMDSKDKKVYNRIETKDDRFQIISL